MKTTTTIMQSLKTAILALIIGLGVTYAVAWVGPTQAPPLANVPGPINKGTAEQIIPNDILLKGKTGTELFRFNSLGMLVEGIFETRSNTYLATNGGKVGIGTTNPQSTLDVNGTISVHTGSSVSYVSALWGIDAIGRLTVCDDSKTTGNCETKDSVGGVGESAVFDGFLWVGGWGSGNSGNLYKCDSDGKCQNTGNKTSGRGINAMAVSGGSLWLGDSSGYLYKCGNSGICSNEGDKGGSIAAMTVDSVNLWLAHSGGAIDKCDTSGTCVKTFSLGSISSMAIAGNTLFVGISGDVAKVKSCDINTKVCTTILTKGTVDGVGDHITAMTNFDATSVAVAAASDVHVIYPNGIYTTTQDYNEVLFCSKTGCSSGLDLGAYYSSDQGLARSMVADNNATVFAGKTSWTFSYPQLFAFQATGGVSKVSGPVYGLNIFNKAIHTSVKSVTMSDGDLSTSGDMNMGGNLITGGTNSWIFHTPDDGRTDLYIAPKTNGAWDWANELKIDNAGNMDVNGDVNVSGKASVSGLNTSGPIFMNNHNISQAGDVNAIRVGAGERMSIGKTDQTTWPTCGPSFAGVIRFNNAFYGCEFSYDVDNAGSKNWHWQQF